MVLLADQHLIVEVKAIRRLEEASFRISKKQINRLVFARQKFEDHLKAPIQLRFLFVQNNQNHMELSLEDML